jgi:glycosyltransferase involved in cell wall biosynthesis
MAVSVLFQLQKTYSNATLTMVGPDKDGSLITTKAFADQLGVKVNFTGKLSKEDWCRLAIDNDIFINTTHFDNTPVSVMEAMALGLPVVSTNVGGIPYLITHEETAMLVNAADVDQMTCTILGLISNKEKTIKMVQNARILIEKMDWNIVKQDWNLLLK